MNLRSALKGAQRTRGTSVATVAFIAITVAALTTAFNLADGALWRPPPLNEPDRLVIISSTHKTPNRAERRARWSYARIQEIKRRAQSYTLVANFTSTSSTLTGPDLAEIVSGEFVSSEYFRVLGVQVQRGRALLASDDSTVDANPMVVISDNFWQRRLQGRNDVLGSTIVLNEHPFTIVGVMSTGFRGLSGTAEFWAPSAASPIISYPEYLTTDQDFINVIGRLKPGVSIEQASTEAQRLGVEVYAAAPIRQPDAGLVSGASVSSLDEIRISRSTRRSVLTLFIAVFLLHLLSCANVVSLLLGKAAARRREVAIRQALGATRAKLVPEVLAESALLITFGGAVGLLLAFWVNAFMPAADQLWNTQSAGAAIAAFAAPAFGLRSVSFGLVLIVATALLVCWVPTAGLIGLDMSSNLRDGARGYTVGGATLRRPNARGVIVAIEGALAIVLLMAGSLMINSFARMRSTDLGIDGSNVLTFDLRVPEAKVPADRAPAFVTSVLEKLAAVPGVVSATVDGGAPVSGSANSTLIVAGRPLVAEDLQPPVLRHYVGPDHFKTLGIPLISGRAFNNGDAEGRPRVIIISELAAKRFWPGQNPIGQRVWFGGGSNFDSFERSGEIVGVVGDVAYQPLDREPFRPDFYTPYMQFTYASRMVFVRTTGDPTAMIGPVRAAMKELLPEIALRDLRPMNELVGQSWIRQRFDATLFGVFAALALLLSTSGIYAVVSYAINQRTREMGIRLALGASKSRVIQLVVREGMMFPLIGLFVGLIISLAMSRVIAASLYEVSPTDPFVVLRTVAILATGSLLACFLPAFRATRVDPLVAIRTD